MNSTRVDFYLLNEHVPDGKLKAACRLSKKIIAQNLTAYIRATDADQAARLDDLLWTFDQGSFIPHRLDWNDGETAPVIIGQEPPASENPEVLINLGAETPEHFRVYQRVAEIVDALDADKQLGRQRYKLYKDNGCQLETHHISP